MIRPQDRLPLESPVCVHDWLWVPLIQAYRCVCCKYEIPIGDLMAIPEPVPEPTVR